METTVPVGVWVRVLLLDTISCARLRLHSRRTRIDRLGQRNVNPVEYQCVVLRIHIVKVVKVVKLVTGIFRKRLDPTTRWQFWSLVASYYSSYY
jgi:hypothetical protein